MPLPKKVIVAEYGSTVTSLNLTGIINKLNYKYSVGEITFSVADQRYYQKVDARKKETLGLVWVPYFPIVNYSDFRTNNIKTKECLINLENCPLSLRRSFVDRNKNVENQAKLCSRCEGTGNIFYYIVSGPYNQCTQCTNGVVNGS